MQTHEILSRVNDAISLVEANNSPLDALKSLASGLEAQVRHEVAKSSGSGNAVKTVEAMLKPMLESRTALAYAWIDSKGRQCICDGFQAYRLKKHLPLPKRPEIGRAHV